MTIQVAADWQHEAEVSFRGVTRTVFFDHEGDHVINWCFEDENTCLGVDTTQEEQDQIYQTLWDWMEDWWAPRPEDDFA